MRPRLSFFIALSAIGLLLSVAAHIAVLMGAEGPLSRFTPALHLGIFVVWISAVFASIQVTKGVHQKERLQAALRGCPGWMKYAAYAFFFYAFINMAFFVNMSSDRSEGFMPPGTLRGFSGLWMAFYAMAFAVLYSAAKLRDGRPPTLCQNGHRASPEDRFCKECGRSITRDAPGVFQL